MGDHASVLFEKTVVETETWLSELMRLAHEPDRDRALRLLRVGLHTIRDRLTVDEAAHLGAQMPMLLRGLYFEGWRPAFKPAHERTQETFLAHIRDAFESDPAEEDAAKMRAVFRLLERHISGGELEDVRHSLPKPIRALWPE